MFKSTKIIAAVIITCTFGFGFDTPYGDHFYTLEGADSLLSGAVTIDGIVSSATGDFIQLADNRTTGYIILAPGKQMSLIIGVYHLGMERPLTTILALRFLCVFHMVQGGHHG